MENTQQRLSELQQKIIRLKKEKDIAVLAHSYQTADILEIADQTGDSFNLSTAAMELSQKTVLMCGVRFMADTVKLLSPEKTVILPAAEATCPMAEQISPERVYAFKEEHPTYKVVAYINTTTELKAAADTKSEVVAEYAGNVFDYGFGFQGSVCTYLRHGILTVLIADILNNLRPTVFAEVDIKVRRAYAFRIEEAFEQEIIAQWVDIGYFGQVCHYAACAGAASRAYRNIHTFGVADKVAYHQKIAGVFGFDDNA